MRFALTYKLLKGLDMGSPTHPPHTKTLQLERETYM